MDDSPASAGGAERQLVSVETIKDNVARDVEALLNTRKPPASSSDAKCTALQGSILAFGLDDFSSLSLDSPIDRERICAAILTAVRSHEPRLKAAEVALVRDSGPHRRLRFSIRALLSMHPLSEPVNFDAVLQTTTQHYTVSHGKPGV